MSEIANALAKAKERTGQTSAPFLVPGATPSGIDPTRAAAAAAAIKKAKRQQAFWVILITIALPATGYIIWTRLRPEKTETVAVNAHPEPALSPIQPTVEVPVYPTDSTVQTPSPGTPTQPVVTTPKPSVAPRADFMTRVANYAITAVMPGEPPRVVVSGKVVRVGQTVDADLTFAGISEGQLVFTDTRGAVYTRRY